MNGVARLDGKIAVVTGGAGGIGRATVHRLSSEGASLVVVDVDGEGADRVAEEITRAGGSAIGKRADVSSEEEMRALFGTVKSHFGGVDILHNNAGGTGSDGVGADLGLLKMSVEVWDRTMAVNVRGAMLGCRFAVPIMVGRGGGSIINTSSNGALFGVAALTAYTASKAALLGLTRQVATEFGKSGVRCNAVAPGLVLTEKVRNSFTAAALAEAESQNLVPFIGTPEQIAGVVAFLASDDAAFVTGHILVADGGLTAGRLGTRLPDKLGDDA